VYRINGSGQAVMSHLRYFGCLRFIERNVGGYNANGSVRG